MEKTFKQRYIEGECEFAAIDDCVEAWHNNKAGENITLQEYLGFTNEEYELLLKTSEEFKKYMKQLREAAK